MSNKWKSDTIPQHTIMIKYLRRILKPAELEDLLTRYVAAKQEEIKKKSKKIK